jgi:hypothetical protein
MNLRDVNWRFALYSGGLLGGVVWAVLAGIVINARDGVRTTGFSVPPSQWLIIGGTSLAILLAGAVLIVLARSIVLRSTGIGLVVSALAGWVMIAWILVQFAIGE